MKNLSLRISDREKEHLERFCKVTERNQSDILRQFIRGLKIEGVLKPLDD